MSRTFLAALALTAGLSTAALAPEDARSDDHAAVERAAQDYVDAIYLVKPELIDRSVSRDLVKLGIWRQEGATDYSEPMGMTYAQLHDLAGKWNVDDRNGKDLASDVEVLDLLDRTATVKLTASWGVDYMHLLKQGEKWQIVQILWQSHPPTE